MPQSGWSWAQWWFSWDTDGFDQSLWDACRVNQCNLRMKEGCANEGPGHSEEDALASPIVTLEQS